MKRWLAILLSLLLMLCMSSCAVTDTISDLIHINDVVAADEAIPHIGFSRGELFDEEEIIYTADEFADVESDYAAYRGHLHFDTLNETEQLLYRAFEFAMENGYNNVLVDDLLCDDRTTLYRVLKYLALDSPLLEQNLRYHSGTFTAPYTVTVAGFYEANAKFDGLYLTVDNFTEAFWDKKLEAIKQAEKIVDTRIQAGQTDIEKAETLFRYLSDITIYTDYANDEEVQTYLHDMMFSGKSNCDGSANALSLLLQIAGINSVEKMVNDTGKEPAEGHTWTFAEIDGQWYNFDCTGGSDTPVMGTALHAGRFFAFGDELQKYVPDYQEVYPASKDSRYLVINGRLSSESSVNFIDTVKSGLRSNNNRFTLLILRRCDKTKLKSQMQQIANYLNTTVSWTRYSLHDGSTLVLIYKKGLFPK